MAGVGLEECLEQVSRGVAREHRMRQLGELTRFFPQIDRIFSSATSKRYLKG